MKKYVLLSVVIVLGIMFASMFFSSDTIVNYPPKNTKIVAFGDSLVFGYGATKGNDFVSLLRNKLKRDIVNLGRSGDTSADGLSRLDEALKENPGIVVLLLGGNDYLKRVPQEETQKNLGRIIEKLQGSGSVVVLLGVRGGIITDGRDSMYKALSEQYGAVYVEDILDGIFLKPTLMFDGIHPNDAGYAIIANRVHEVFTENDL